MAAVDNTGEPSRNSQDFPAAKLQIRPCVQAARVLTIISVLRQFLLGGLGQVGDVRVKCYGLGRCSRG